VELRRFGLTVLFVCNVGDQDEHEQNQRVTAQGQGDAIRRGGACAFGGAGQLLAVLGTGKTPAELERRLDAGAACRCPGPEHSLYIR
jgi:hypothetical protein